MTDPIVAEQLTKTYSNGTKAVQGISFSVRSGEAFGFLGPNGAGKTTTVSMLSAGLAPTSGRGMVGGLDIARDASKIKRRIGIVFQESTADGDLTGRENLEVSAALYGLPRREARRRTEELLQRMELAEAADRLVKTYSGGMRRRLELGVGIVHSPPILFLDEPTLGLDPQGRAGFWRYIRGLRSEHGLTVFLTTHYLDEADQLCDRIAIVDHGQIVATGTPAELKDKVGGDVVTIRPVPGAADPSAVLRALPGALSVQPQDGTVRLKCESGERMVPLAVEACARAGVGVAGVSVQRPSLDEVFLQFTGREYREEEGPTATDRAVRIQRLQERRR